jgi:hypothetical protein
MDNLINSLVGNFVSNAGNANMGQVTDYQGKTYDRDQLLALSKQVAGSIDPNAIKGGVFSTKGESVGFNYDEATKLLGHPPSAAEQVILDMSRHLLNEGVTDLNQADASDTNRRFGSTYTGGGGTIYELKKDADGKPIISSWSKDTSDKKAIIGGLALAAAAFGIPGVTEGLLSGAPAGATLGTVGAEAAGTSTLGSLASGGTGLIEGSSLSGLTGGSSLSGLTGGTLGATNSALGGAALGSTLAGASTLPIGTTLGALGAAGAGSSLLSGAAAGAAGSALGSGAGSALGTTLGQGLALNALGTGLGAIANQSGISNARDAITQGSATANTALNNAYTNAQNLNTANTTALGNNYQNLNTNLNNALNAQAGVYNTTGTNLANNYANLGTTLKGTLADQVAAYEAANQGINTNAQNQLGLLSGTYEGQKAQAAANAAALNANYNTTLGKMGDVYNQQVGFQQPYQDVGAAGAQGLIDNQGYLTRQFGASDLNEQLAPNYAFQLQQGQMANQRAANMGGGSLGGNALRGLQDYTQNYAAGAYQNAFNNFNTQRQNIYSTLAGMANIGTTSGGQLASLGNTYGSNMGSLSSNLGGNLTTNAGNLLSAGNAYGSNTSGVVNNLNNVLSSNLGQMQNAYNQYGSNVTGASNAYGSNVLGNANQMQGAYNQYGSNLTGASNTYGGNLTQNAATGVNAANVYGLNSANLATGIAGALAGNASATGANNATALSNLGNTALLGSMIKAT